MGTSSKETLKEPLPNVSAAQASLRLSTVTSSVSRPPEFTMPPYATENLHSLLPLLQLPHPASRRFSETTSEVWPLRCSLKDLISKGKNYEHPKVKRCGCIFWICIMVHIQSLVELITRIIYQGRKCHLDLFLQGSAQYKSLLNSRSQIILFLWKLIFLSQHHNHSS